MTDNGKYDAWDYVFFVYIGVLYLIGLAAMIVPVILTVSQRS